ncbi:heparan-alpha-glucosaminide N-acetyltransferase-like [Palaemon carinicauda]|uniref:heparan-alpha-glucosaminide N-acetyltransferase-like n=1 Tax=Palaemon carinicauda TaxID=392227 RepID=UPI0035B672DE
MTSDIKTAIDWREFLPTSFVHMTEALVMDLKAATEDLHSSIPPCGYGDNEKSLSMDQACLEVLNTDLSSSLEFWAQSIECYKCPPWKYLLVEANSSASLVVNSTYPTDVFIKALNGTNVQNKTYHFGQYGSYLLDFDTDHIHVKTFVRPQPEILAIVMAIVFFALLALLWQCGKFILRRMDSPDTSVPPRVSEQSRRFDTLVETATYDPQPGPSSESDPLLHSNDVTQVQSVHTQEQVPDSRRSGGRLVSLDVFRGTAIAIMIFVNYGGGKYYFFIHARWNGLTVADLVFPWFLWIMGVSLTFSIRSQLRRATKRYIIVLKILKRCVILFALGIVINSKSSNYLPTFRILGVLQRFAFCYLISAIIEVYFMSPQQSPEYVWYWKIRDVVRSWFQWTATLVLVIVHTVITFKLPVPGCPTGYIGPGGLHDGGAYSNCTGGAAGYIDRLVLGDAHVYKHPTCAKVYDTNVPYDPEGLLGVLTSILMVQFGVAAGRIIVTYRSHNSRLLRWIIWGAISGIIAGILCGFEKEGGPIPVNKNLWSLSFVLTTNCFAFFLLSFYYLVIDKLSWWSGNPVRYVGMNAIILYLGHEILGNLLPWSWSPVGHYHVNYLIMNIWGTSLWVVFAYILHLKKVYISV